MSLTAAQQEAITARGNVLVVAGAGTGKTRTLVERCLDCLSSETPRGSLDELLMVTFTEAAAAEMRQRIRARLEDLANQQPGEAHWREQLALFESAHIGTLHSFCLRLVRQHFYELELDPQLSVLAEAEARLLAEETLEKVLQKHYAGRGEEASAVQRLIQIQGRGWDKPIRGLVLRLHHYMQTRPDPSGWLRGQLASFAASEPKLWQAWLLQGISDWRESWRESLASLAGENDMAATCLGLLGSLPAQFSRKEAAVTLAATVEAGGNCPRGKKALWFEPLKHLFAEAKFLYSLACEGGATGGGADPLVEDWAWVRAQVTTLLRLAQEFTEAFTETKRELGMVDFHDLEQYALRLLWDPHTNQPTKTALGWRKKLRFIFVDEYQDINAAQDKIIEALSREGPQANRFLVGDVKQSIYRFRLADPGIFQGYIRQWSRQRGQTIALVENFRSRERILDFINSLFSKIMRPEVGGIAYDQQAHLRFGAPEERRELSAAVHPGACVELHVRIKNSEIVEELDAESSEALAEVRDLEEAAKEARMLALRLIELMVSRHPVWDESIDQFRPVQWRDIALLLRSPAKKAESYAKEFARLKVPLQVAQGGFYENLEISDLLSLLHLLDNPLQDLPVLAVLHSPLVGLTLNELATIRLAAPKTHFWSALNRFRVHSPQSPVHSPRPTGEAETLRKVRTFLERFAHWRRLARRLSLSRCLQAVLSETHYGDWLLTQPRGEQRYANVQRLVGLAQQFDQFQRQGLFRFLRFIEAQQLAETEPEVAAVTEENAVRLMSIHQSKGLEFPIVVAADLGKTFNLKDVREDIILDEQFGLCPQIKPPHIGKRYPSLPHWLASRRQIRELLGEELRLLYVAMTRARDTLILSGSTTTAKFNRIWRQPKTDNLAVPTAANYSDWLGFWFAQHFSADGGPAQGENELLRWFIHSDAKLIASETDLVPASSAGEMIATEEPGLWLGLQQRLSWEYPFAGATCHPAKTSVSALRRRAVAAQMEEAASLFRTQSPKFKVRGSKVSPPGKRVTTPGSKVSAVDVGNAHHSYLQLVRLQAITSLAGLKSEAERLEQEGALSAEETALLDFKALASFGDSDLGRKICSQAQSARRELEFTARFAASELASLTGVAAPTELAEEFVVVQGVADLVVILPREIWLVDFKTDEITPGDISAKSSLYAPQLQIYALALSRIYRLPVTECWLYFLTGQKAVAVKTGL